MRKFLTFLSAAAVLSTPAFSQARGFESDFTQALTGPFKLEIVVSEDLAHRTHNLPKDLSARTSRARPDSSFLNNGHYGAQEIEFLLKELEKDLIRDFKKRGLNLSDQASTLLRVTIVDAMPNRPTTEQLSQDVNLSFQSIGTGGAEVSAEFIDASGAVLGTAEYDYFSTFNDPIVVHSTTWRSATKAFDRFSRRLSKKLEKCLRQTAS